MIYVVIYYDGNDTKAKLVEHEHPEQITREDVGCPPFGDITAIVQVSDNTLLMQVTERDDMCLVLYDSREAISGDKVIIFPEDV